MPNATVLVDSVTAGAPGAVPVPLRETLCGESLALSTKVIAALNGPVVAGVKVPLSVQLDPAVKVVPQVLGNEKDDAFVPVTVMLVMSSVAVPVLVNLTVMGELVVVAT